MMITIENTLKMLGMRKVTINGIDDFEDYLFIHKNHIASLKKDGITADAIITIVKDDKIITSGSVRFIDINPFTGYGFTVMALNGSKTEFTYTPDCTVYIKTSIIEQWD